MSPSPAAIWKANKFLREDHGQQRWDTRFPNDLAALLDEVRNEALEAAAALCDCGKLKGA